METESHSQVLIPVLCSKLSEDLLQEWYRTERTRETIAAMGMLDIPQDKPLAQFSNFLEEQITIRRRARIQRQGIGSIKSSSGKDVMPRQTKRHQYQREQRSHSSHRDDEVSASALYSKTEHKSGARNTSTHRCIFCEGQHASYQCVKAKSMELSLKRRLVREKNACWNCLRVGHQVKECNTKVKCRICKFRHNTLLHSKKEEGNKDNDDAKSEKSVDGTPNFSGTSVVNQEVMLMTVKAEIVAEDGTRTEVRCLFDNGSEKTFLSAAIAKKIGCHLEEDPSISIVGIGGNLALSQGSVKTTKIRLGARNKRIIGEMKVLVVDKVCATIRKVPQGPWLPKLKRLGINLTDEVETYEGEEKPIDLLIGSDYYWEYVLPQIRRLEMGPTAVKTKLGWSLNGPIQKTLKTHSMVNAVFVKARVDDSVDTLVKSFWELEAMGIADRELNERELLLNEQETRRFDSTTRQRDDLHYEVELPKANKALPESNKFQALSRLKQLTKKLDKDTQGLQRYNQEIQNLLNSNFAEKVPDKETDNPKFYVPHRAVIRESRETTKVRIVFDGSAKDSQGVSLNDCLATGQNLNPELVQLLLQYRTHEVALIGDIEKAFLQIFIQESDKDLCRFFWYDDPCSENREIVEYRMTRVLFGLNCSPYLLAATVKHHCKKYKEEFPKTVESLLTQMYVDDWVTGGDSVEEAFSKYQQGTEILAKGGFALRKWKTNSVELHKEIYNTADQEEEVHLMGDDISKILGVKWCTRRDALVYGFKDFVTEAKRIETIGLTKRTLLSLNMRVFDPLGLISPIVIEAKLMVQDLWRAGIGWDQLVPQKIQLQWEKWLHGLEEVEEIVFPRHVGPLEGAQLHVFTDASVNAYAAVVYIRNEVKGEITTTLLASKTRVAPLKPITIHRMELLGMVLGVRLAEYIKESYQQIEWGNVYFWSDSQVCLHWVKNDPRRWKPFVSNRVVEVQEKTVSDMSHWRYCSGRENPADLPSRGVNPIMLKDSMWLQGPEWLAKDESHWPPAFDVESAGKDAEKEQRKKLFGANIAVPNEEQFSTLTPQLKEDVLNEAQPNEVTSLTTKATETWMDTKICKKYRNTIRTTAWCMRYLNNLKNKVKPERKEIVPLQLEEIKAAETYWWKVVQRDQYPDEIAILQRDKKLNKSEILQLDPYLDDEGLIRIKGRLKESDLVEGQKHPIIVNERHWLVTQFINYCHSKLGHVGVNETLICTREKVWIIRGRQVTKKIIRRCVDCNKFQGKPYNQVPAPLPRDRVVEGKPFDVVGIDFFGPIYLKSCKTINPVPNPETSSKMYKSYGLIITCAKTRAVHLELLTSMETGVFLQAFQRFVHRRGTPSVVYSDNAKTFKKSSKLLQCKNVDLFTDASLQNYATEKEIKWIFIAERAPWWGGMWERLIRNIKNVARKKLGKARLSYEEMITLLVEIEGIVNSRPLTYTYSEPNEPTPVSPSDLLIGKRITSLPEGITSGNEWTEPLNVERRLKYKEKLAEEFWRTWKQEYLMDLKKTNLKFKETSIPEVGDVCVISEDNVKRTLWPLGLITKLYHGRDGKVRSVQLRSRNKLITRPIQRLVPIVKQSTPLPDDLPALEPSNNQDNAEQSSSERNGGEHNISESAVQEEDTQPSSDECALLPEQHIGGECKNSRPQRTRKRPAYLKDYVE